MSRIRNILIGAAIITGALASAAPVHAQCVAPPFAPNWLLTQEAPNVIGAPGGGGHTIALHVGQTIPQLINRVLNGGVNAAGSYPTIAGAQGTITAALTANAVAINNWRANGGFGGGPVPVGTTRGFDYAAPANIGTVAFTVGNPPNAVGSSQTCAFRVVLRARPGNNCYLVTSYPRPATPGDHCP